MEIKRYIDFINESSKYKSINSVNFIKLFNKITNHYKEMDSSIINDFKHKLFDYVSKDQSKKFPINFFSTEYKKLIDIIHVLDNKNAEIFLLKNKKSVVDVSLPDLKPVWMDEDKKIYVYHAKTMFEAITLGRGTNFCVSADYKNGSNYFNYYVYSGSKQISSMYFVKSFSQKQEYQTLCIDAIIDGSFLYTDVRNDDKKYGKYNLMLKDKYTSPDLKIIPEHIFKFIPTTPTKEEIEIDFSKNRSLGLLLINRDKYSVIQLLEELKGMWVSDQYRGTTEKDYYCAFLRTFHDSDRSDLKEIISLILDRKKEYTIPIMQTVGVDNGYEDILVKIEREYKIFLIIVDIISRNIYIPENGVKNTSSSQSYFYNALEIINLEDSDSYYGDYYTYMFYYDFLIKSVGNIKIEELKEVIGKYSKFDKYFFENDDMQTKDRLLLFEKLIKRYGKKVLNLIYYKENYDKKYGNNNN
jgi:predicted SnoaL-like aldol condensation-catalyzing enzyme